MCVRKFHHTGLPTTEVQPGEYWVESTRVWVSNPAHHAQRTEWLRYEPDSPVDREFQQNPHVDYTVDNLSEHLTGKEILLGPFEVGEPPFAQAAFTRENDLITEYMQLYAGRQWFNNKLTD